MYKKFLANFIFIIALSCPSLTYAANNFVPGIEDLPVPLNFHLKENSSSVFFNDSGRIIESTFIGTADPVEINEFYHKTLQALGWQKQKKLVFLREKEILKISLTNISSPKKHLEIHFSLQPQF
jgi:hypothetical protein